MPRIYLGYTTNRAKANLDALWAAIVESACDSTAEIPLPDEVAVIAPTYYGHTIVQATADIDALWAMLPGVQPAWPADSETRQYRGRASTAAKANLHALYAALRALNCCDDDDTPTAPYVLTAQVGEFFVNGVIADLDVEEVEPPPSCNSALVQPELDLWFEDFCPYESKGEWETAAAALAAASDPDGFGLLFEFHDYVVEDDVEPSAYAFGTMDPWNGGHHYVEQVYPAGVTAIRGLKFVATQAIGNNLIAWRTFQDVQPDPEPSASWQRLVCMFSSGYTLTNYEASGAYHSLLRCQGLAGYRETGPPFVFIGCIVDLQIINTDELSGGPRLVLTTDAALAMNGTDHLVDLGDADTLVFDGLVHTWELETTRTGADQSRQIVVLRDGVELANILATDVGEFTVTFKHYMPWKLTFFDCENPPNGFSGGALPAEQSWRVYELEGDITPMPA